ncbi:MAG: hypothetical protein WBR15_03815 [Gammaproteobacteria bacterium]
MPRLYTYCIPYDDGAAPNPYWGICTLAICKPMIRRTAEVGDWVVGTGSRNSPIGDISSKVVYAMRVTQKLSMSEYDSWSRKSCPKKIPNMRTSNLEQHLGDSIYNFSTSPPKQRMGVHDAGNISTDLSGLNVLLSSHFFYFGDKPRKLPARLQEIVKQGQGHRVKLNEPFVEPFQEWVNSLKLQPNKLYGEPPHKLSKGASVRAACAAEDAISPIC